MNRTSRGIVLVLSMFVLVNIAGVEHVAFAQEMDWPLPGISPDVMVGAEYALETFDHIYTPMHQGVVYGGIRSTYGAYFLKLARGRRFSRNGSQGEFEAYPPLGDRMYGYLSYAYGETPVYPRHRIGIEVYRGLPWSLEGSLGARYYSFLNDRVDLVS